MSFIKKNLRESIEYLFPGYFAMVMATGIVSIAAFLLEIEWLAQILFIFNIIFFIVLGILYVIRLIVFPHYVFNDFIDHQRSVGFFSLVAGTSILGSQFFLISKNKTIALILLALAFLLWIFLIYGILISLLVKEKKPSLEEGINGSWLVSVVATQAISIFSSLLFSSFGAQQKQILFLSLTMWLFGGMLYIWFIILIVQRYFFLK